MSPASLELMRTPQVRKRPTTDEMGVGWHLRRLNGVLTAAHCGTWVYRLHLQLVPDRSLAFALLTNHDNGWKLNEDVAAAILQEYEGLALAPNQRTGGDRGGGERMHLHAEPLAAQPARDQYVGRYEAPPFSRASVSVEDGHLVVDWTSIARLHLSFYAPDMAFVVPNAGNDFGILGEWEGLPCEFVRDPGGEVTWLRVAGRVLRRT